MDRRRWAMVLGGVAAVLLFFLVNPWVILPEGIVHDLALWGFWISFIVLLVVLFQERNEPGGATVEIEGPAFTRFLFSNSKAGLFWLPIRLFLGFSWIEAGWHKLTGEGWIDGGSALAGYWANAVKIPAEGRVDRRSPTSGIATSSTSCSTGHHETWFAWLITLGELAVGLGLLLGALTGLAAFFGALMNMSFLLAGSASSNPVLFTLAIGLILAWKVAGYYGLDRYLLPMLGTPWHPGVITGRETHPTGPHPAELPPADQPPGSARYASPPPPNLPRGRCPLSLGDFGATRRLIVADRDRRERPRRERLARRESKPADLAADSRRSSSARHSAHRRRGRPAAGSSRGSAAASPQTATWRPAPLAAVTTPAMSRSTAGWRAVASSARAGFDRSAASVYWTRSLVPMLKKSATSRQPVGHRAPPTAPRSSRPEDRRAAPGSAAAADDRLQPSPGRIELLDAWRPSAA